MCVKNWRFMRGGKVWGDDMIIDALHLMDHSQAVAITYVEVFILTRESLDSSAEGYPHALTVIDRAARRIRLQRALLIFFCERMGKQTRQPDQIKTKPNQTKPNQTEPNLLYRYQAKVVHPPEGRVRILFRHVAGASSRELPRALTSSHELPRSRWISPPVPRHQAISPVALSSRLSQMSMDLLMTS